MDFGTGMAAGFSAGMGSGFAVGVSAGRKQAKHELLNHMEQRGITVLDRFGKPMKTDDFLDVAVSCQDTACGQTRSRIWLAMALLLAIAIAASVTAFILI